MKKIIRIAVVFAGLVMLIGCNKKSNSKNIAQEELKFDIPESDFNSDFNIEDNFDEIIIDDTEVLEKEEPIPKRERLRESEEAKIAFESAVELTGADFEYELTTDGEGVVITKYLSNNTSIKIPSEIEGMPVLELSERLFEYNRDIKDYVTVVVIPDTVKILGKNLFWDSQSIQYVKMSESVTELPDGAFYNCKNLKEFYIPDSVSSIGAGVFYNAGIKSIDLPDGIKYKEVYNSHGVFEGSKIEHAVLPRDWTSIPSYFFESSKLIDIEIPSSVTVIGFAAFKDCKYLSSIILPDNLEEIESSAFEGTKLLNEFVVPSSVKKIGNKAFGNSGIKRLELPDMVTTLSDNYGRILWENYDLEYLRISDNITELKYQDLKDTLIKTVNLPSSLKICESEVFPDSLEELRIPDSLTSVQFDNKVFERIKLPLSTQKRLRELGYTGTFAGSRSAQ